MVPLEPVRAPMVLLTPTFTVPPARLTTAPLPRALLDARVTAALGLTFRVPVMVLVPAIVHVWMTLGLALVLETVRLPPPAMAPL